MSILRNMRTVRKMSGHDGSVSQAIAAKNAEKEAQQAQQQQQSQGSELQTTSPNRKGYSIGENLLTLIQEQKTARKGMYALAGEQGAITEFSHGQIVLG